MSTSQPGPKFGKKSLSFFVRNDCPRQFRLSLYDQKLLQSGQMPSRQSNRPLSGQAAEAGDEWQNQVVGQIEDIFGATNVWVEPTPPPVAGKTQRPGWHDLEKHLPQVEAHQFIVEARFEVTDAFKSAFDLQNLRDSDALPLGWSRLNPDIIQVLPPAEGALLVRPDGEIVAMPAHDARLQLRIIDVKLASEPGAHYFGEIAYYSMALAGWLLDHAQWNEKFVVSAEAAVWPGSYELSALSNEHRRQRTSVADLELLLQAMQEDLEPIVFEVYASRLARFFRRELPQLLRTPWRKLEWHPNFRCQNCDYLGYDWQADLPADPKFPRAMPDAGHCWQEAERENLICRVPGLTRGGAQKLRSAAPTIIELSALHPDDDAWQTHSNLRGKKHLIVARAQSLRTGNSAIIAESGACATMPSWANLKIYLTLDYDPSSAITAALSMRADWLETPARPETLEIAPDLPRGSQKWGTKQDGEGVWMVDARTVEVEEREFLRFLETLQEIFDGIRAAETPRIEAGAAIRDAENERRKELGIRGRAENREKGSSFQIYLWDDAQLRHLQRLVGRHLEAITAHPKIKSLAWLFPAPQLLPDENLAGRTSPISLVGPAIENHVAVPVPHHYTLLEVARYFVPDGMTPPFVKWNYREPLTNLVPSERIHEWWTRQKNWRQVEGDLAETSRAKTFALSLVTQKFYDEAKNALQLARSGAPTIPELRESLRGVPASARLWHGHVRLNAAIARIEAESLYALAPQNRELRGKSAHLTQRLSDADDIEAALGSINIACGTRLTADPDLAIYQLAASSRDANLKAGAFGALLSPCGEDLFALKSARARLAHTAQTLGEEWWQNIEQTGLTGVTIEAIDREGLFVALRWGEKNRIDCIVAADNADFSADVMLDILPFDVLSSKVKMTLERIGTPNFALADGDIAQILPPAVSADAPAPRKGKAAQLQPAHEFLYAPQTLSVARNGRDVAALRPALEATGVRLNDSQWAAWQAALENRLSVIWGPPGTGKSQTLRAICRSAIADAVEKQKPLRLLVTAHTYSAVDELLRKIAAHFAENPIENLSIFRIQSSWREAPDLTKSPNIQSIILERTEPCEASQALYETLENPGQSLVIVGTVPGQVHQLAQIKVKSPSAPNTQKAWFDLVLLDEASQMDVVGSALVWSKMALGSSCVLAGDDLQMSPIHQAEAPQGQEDLVGSAFNFLTRAHKVAKHALNINYRSNAPIVECVRRAGYDDALQSHSPALELNLRHAVPLDAPANWSNDLPFSASYAELLDARKAAGCFVYDDPNLSGQSNAFEAQTLAALARLLYGTMGQCKNRRDENGLLLPTNPAIYDVTEFWKSGIGVVAPHRAQGSLIVESLRGAFKNTGATPALIRDAVDTVERFQGQERDVILASFGLGDPDMVALEDEFLFSLNRFNVLISRARAKALVLISRGVLNHLSDDQKVVRESALLKSFVERQCQHSIEMELPYICDGVQTWVKGEFRFT